MGKLDETTLRNNVTQEFEERLLLVRQKIRAAALSSGRSEKDITLIGVSKLFPVDSVRMAIDCGLVDLGENYVQELVEKDDALRELGLCPRWHMIGGLQSNKVKYLIGRTELVHSVASMSVATEFAKRSCRVGRETKILLQVNISLEESKQGFCSDDLPRAMEAVQRMDGIRLCGLMTMAPICHVPHASLSLFEKTREVYEKMRQYTRDPAEWTVLSMGMSGDYEDAIACGATHVRIGTAIFGSRNREM